MAVRRQIRTRRLMAAFVAKLSDRFDQGRLHYATGPYFGREAFS
jgi:hypothetical protein